MANKAPKLTMQSIHDASTAEILQFAEEAAGLTFEDNVGRDWVIQEIFTALEWDAYKPEDDATHVIINLPVTKDEKHPYQGGFNGRMFTVKRGVDIEIPIGFYNTMVESAVRRYKLESIGQSGEIEEGSPASKRLPIGALDMRVIRFLNKGKVKNPKPVVVSETPKNETPEKDTTKNKE